MKIIPMPRPNEQRKIEELLVKLSKMKPASVKSAAILRATSTAHPRVFFST